MLNDCTREEQLIDLYFFAIGQDNFIKALENYSEAQGFGIEHIWCIFAGEVEEWEEGYFGESGVCFFFDHPAVEKDEVLILNYPTFYRYLKENAVEHLKRYPNNKHLIETLLNKIKQNLGIF